MRDDFRKHIFDLLLADTTLRTLTGGDGTATNGRIYFGHSKTTPALTTAKPCYIVLTDEGEETDYNSSADIRELRCSISVVSIYEDLLDDVRARIETTLPTAYRLTVSSTWFASIRRLTNWDTYYDVEMGVWLLDTDLVFERVFNTA